MSGRRQGFALLIVLLTMGFLALLGGRLLASARVETGVAESLRQEAVLEAAADGAVQNVVFAMQAAKDPAFQPDGLPRVVRVGGIAVVVRVTNESDRVDLNKASISLLRAVITEAGVRPAVAEHLAGAIIDWRTTGPASWDGGPKAPRYLASGLGYTPPGTPFKTMRELLDVLGMTPGLFAQLEPHLTVLTGTDPDLATLDPVVARALTDVAGGTNPAGVPPRHVGDVLRIVATAQGQGEARYSVRVVAAGDFRPTAIRVTILLRQRIVAGL